MQIDLPATIALVTLATWMHLAGIGYDAMAVILTGAALWLIHLRKQYTLHQLQQRINKLCRG